MTPRALISALSRRRCHASWAMLETKEDIPMPHLGTHKIQDLSLLALPCSPCIFLPSSVFPGLWSQYNNTPISGGGGYRLEGCPLSVLSYLGVGNIHELFQLLGSKTSKFSMTVCILFISKIQFHAEAKKREVVEVEDHLLLKAL